MPRIELGTSCVLSRRHNQLDHTSCHGVSGFRSQYLVLAKDARFRLRQYPDSGAYCPYRSQSTPWCGKFRAARFSGPNQCVHSTRVVFHPSKVKIRVRVPMDAFLLPRCALSIWRSAFLKKKETPPPGNLFRHGKSGQPAKSPPTVGIEPTTTRLKVLRSTTELGGTGHRVAKRHWTAAWNGRFASGRQKTNRPHSGSNRGPSG